MRRFCPSCRQVHYANPVPAAAVVVPNGHGRVLLVKRSVAPKIGCWCLPGGFIEIDETPEQAALRELAEETGLTGRIDRLLDVFCSASDIYAAVLLVGYLVKDVTGQPTPGDDASQLSYFDPDHLPPVAFDSHAHFLTRALPDIPPPAICPSGASLF